MAIPPSVFVIETCLDYTTIGIARCDMGTRPPLNFQNTIPIWPLRLQGIIEMAITPSVFVIMDICTYIMTLGTSA